MKIVDKPWGYEEWWAQTDKYVGKLLYIKAGHRLSLQYHNIKEESIRVLSGTLTLILDETVLTLTSGESVNIKPKMIHRMEANRDDVTLIEVSTPEVEDIVRLSDDYNRR